MIRLLIASGKLQRDVLGQFLQHASGMGYSTLVQLLLEGNADPNYFPEEDEYQMTPLVGMIFENAPCEGQKYYTCWFVLGQTYNIFPLE
jgi:hypothetical protein